jgi:hypothetical protein
MPPEGGQYPDTWGDYRTYTNSVFVNNTILVPTYEEEWDTTALRIYREALPGYKVVGIDCNEIITASGAIHCITKAVSSNDPLRIAHQPLDDQVYSTNDYEVNALVQHVEGISNATLYWTTDTAAGYNAVAMSLTNQSENTWTGFIPYQQLDAKVFYYVFGEANNGKQQVRPMPAPQGYWSFKILGDPTSIQERELLVGVYPNPSLGLFNINLDRPENVRYSVLDITGKVILTTESSSKSITIDLRDNVSGLYLLKIEWEGGSKAIRLQNL